MRNIQWLNNNYLDQERFMHMAGYGILEYWSLEAVEASEVAEAAEVNEAGEVSKVLKITAEDFRVFQVDNLRTNVTF